MQIPTISGETKINTMLTAAMEVTVRKLIAEGKLSEEVGNDFISSNVCLYADDDIPMWVKIKQYLHIEPKSGYWTPVILSATRPPDNKN